MTAFRVLFSFALLTGLSLPGYANDGFGGISATGLTFGETEKVAMAEEDLFIGIDKIRVSYLFRNISDKDVTGEVIFPVPPIPVGGLLESPWNLPENPDADNLLNFSAVIDGVPVPVSIDRIAVIEPPYDEARPLGAQYDTPGREVTADLARLGVPLTLDAGKLNDMLLAADAAMQAELTELGLAEFYDTDPASGRAAMVYPKWSVLLSYHWTQTFPAGAEVRIAHEYDNHPSGGLFNWTHPPQDHLREYATRYCVDEGTSRAMAKITGEENLGVLYNLSYVLRTANSWAGPIGKYRLTIDKGDPANVVSLCADGIRKTGPTTFVMEKTDYTPDRDIEIMVLQALDTQ